MEIGTIEGATAVLGKPKDWDDSKAYCEGLPIRHDEIDGIPCMVSEWIPTADEALRIMFGAPIHLWMVGAAHPQVSIQIGEFKKAADPQ